MKQNKKLLIIIAGVLILIALIIFLLTRAPKKQYNTFTFPSTMTVKNNTPNRMVDTITMAILNKVMGYDTMKIQIYPMPPMFMNQFIAVITKMEFEKHSYIIFLQNDVAPEMMKTAFSHELIHLRQHESGIFQTLPNNQGYVWKGDSINYEDVPYEKRPYEIEAFSDAPRILHKLNRILYKK